MVIEEAMGWNEVCSDASEILSLVEFVVLFLGVEDSAVVEEAGPKCTLMKNVFEVGSPNWDESTILRLCSARNPVTAWTIPERSGHDNVKTKSSPSGILTVFFPFAPFLTCNVVVELVVNALGRVRPRLKFSVLLSAGFGMSGVSPWRRARLLLVILDLILGDLIL